MLVVACPCGLVLATPAAMLASMAWLARHGDPDQGRRRRSRAWPPATRSPSTRPGTLTQGTPRVCLDRGVTRARPGGRLAAGGLGRVGQPPPAGSTSSSSEARRRGLELVEPRDASDSARRGRAGPLRSRRSAAGDRSWSATAASWPSAEIESGCGDRGDAGRARRARARPSLIVAIDGAIAGVIGVRDAIRPEAHDVIHDLRHLKIREIAILTGDREPAGPGGGEADSRRHGRSRAAARPTRRAGSRSGAQAGRRVAMVGDGINDAPALAQADAGIALGGIGADLAAEAGDLIVLGDPLRVLPELVRLSRSHGARSSARTSSASPSGSTPWRCSRRRSASSGPVAAAILHQVGSLLVLLNSMRLLALRRLGRTCRRFGSFGDLGAWISRLDDRIDLERAWRWAWARRRAAIASALLLAILGYATSGWTAIGPGDVGVLQRFGRFAGRARPGLAPPLALSDRAGDRDRARPGAQARNRVSE